MRHGSLLRQLGDVRPDARRRSALHARGGLRASRRLRFDDAATTEAAFSALAAEIASAEPDPFVMLRTIRLTTEHAERVTALIHDLADQPDDGGDSPRYGLLLGLYRPAGAPSAGR